ncbi:MAG TPA: hypothetical protein VME63_05450 [Dyella sp.]|nr:hypothetical protein [Dyella sp.]HTV84827.1 hypothetical protein [Dyella sp.]
MRLTQVLWVEVLVGSSPTLHNNLVPPYGLRVEPADLLAVL